MVFKDLEYWTQNYAHSLCKVVAIYFQCMEKRRVDMKKMRVRNRQFSDFWMNCPFKTVKHAKLDLSYMPSEINQIVLKYKPSLPLQAEREQRDGKVRLLVEQNWQMIYKCFM